MYVDAHRSVGFREFTVIFFNKCGVFRWGGLRGSNSCPRLPANLHYGMMLAANVFPTSKYGIFGKESAVAKPGECRRAWTRYVVDGTLEGQRRRRGVSWPCVADPLVPGSFQNLPRR